MGLVKRAGDLVYTFRFLRLLTTSFEDTEAYKKGIIDKDGKRLKTFDLNTMDNRNTYKNYYTPFHRLVFNIKKIMAKVPGGGSKIASYAAALFLLKEKFGVSDKEIKKSLNIDPLDFMSEQTEWFVLENNKLSPGSYKVLSEKLINDTFDEVVKPRDKVIVSEDCYPIGEIFGLNIYEVTHSKTNKNIYVAISELSR
tara:strand:+ start:293 stop:883 length:591 start_codon:yes stop_codon:yes gene_type:complete